jgi:ketosteroid isomerase-like protein
MRVEPRDVVRAWVEAFNRADVDALASLYEGAAINHQVAESPVQGRAAIREMLAKGFKATEMVCISNGAIRRGCAAVASSTFATARSPSSADTGTSSRLQSRMASG